MTLRKRLFGNSPTTQDLLDAINHKDAECQKNLLQDAFKHSALALGFSSEKTGLFTDSIRPRLAKTPSPQRSQRRFAPVHQGSDLPERQDAAAPRRGE